MFACLYNCLESELMIYAFGLSRREMSKERRVFPTAVVPRMKMEKYLESIKD